MKTLFFFKFVYIVFIITVASIYHATGDLAMFIAYLLFGAIALLSVLLHGVIAKLETIDRKLTAVSHSGNTYTSSACSREVEGA